jgi:hypothetical protein
MDENDTSMEEACVECAKASGYTSKEAEACDDGDLRCDDCPFEN